jgi:hypothetical protein
LIYFAAARSIASLLHFDRQCCATASLARRTPSLP